ncbi:MAG: family 1 glycosylhydrolase [Chloroflexota bacterium]
MDLVIATGIECSAPLIVGRERRDELLLTQHLDRFVEDFDAVRAFGIRMLRYGIPFHRVAQQPEALDWAWTDEVMEAMRERDIEPVIDLLHFGAPDRFTGFDDPGLRAAYLEYVGAFVERYPWVRWYTPVNEPGITALFSARFGWWNERRSTDRAFVEALDTLVSCAIDAVAIVREARPDARFLHNEACESFRPADPTDPRSVAAAAFLQQRTWLSLDLTLGHPVDPLMRDWLETAGMSSHRLAWFETWGSSEQTVLGLDYYERNEHVVAADGTVWPARRLGYGALAADYHDRYGLPFWLAETNATSDHAVAWLDEMWTDTVALRDAGRPAVGLCWYSLTDQVDWDTSLREPNDHVDSLGLIDLDRRERPVAARFRRIVAEASDMVRGPVVVPLEVVPSDDAEAA